MRQALRMVTSMTPSRQVDPEANTLAQTIAAHRKIREHKVLKVPKEVSELVLKVQQEIMVLKAIQAVLKVPLVLKVRLELDRKDFKA